ncbi:ABC transporter permease [Hypericibacter adhaerens]|uniref:ABC transporter permease n=1 Tax=Hypericibacter adhaerens TaxID=2602016 RepID=A0A5J6MXV5_9PROT|nr:iron ABC transporter permease [Hypericibacter adhaerens]QEX21957.1 ABC transporter permease [Hypericibacter adhaerens]
MISLKLPTRHDRGHGGWWLLSALAAVLVLAPAAAIAVIAAEGSGDLWPHLARHVLPRALRDTLLLLGGVGALTIVIGVGCAWLVTAYDFPGRRVLAWALLLPLAMPTYIVAFAYLDLLHPIGPIQSAIRALLGFERPRDLAFPDIRSLGGCILLLGLVLFPYVYLPTRAMFSMQAAGLVEASRLLGAGPARLFFRIALPLAWPAIAAGATLALLEALNDIGASEFLGVRTLTRTIYDTWINRSSLSGAAQIALLMVAIVLALILLERWARRHRHYAASSRQARRLMPERLGRATGWLAFALAAVPVLLGFVLPAGYLLAAALRRVGQVGMPPSILMQAGNTVLVAAIATTVATLIAVGVIYAVRLARGPAMAALARCASIGYAIPGTVLAIGLLTPLAEFDNAVDQAVRRYLGLSTGLLLSGSGAALVYAYVARFLAVATGGIEAGFRRIPRSLDDAARTLGVAPLPAIWRVHLPLIKPAIGAAVLLVFVDCMKELPATLLLRPLNFETLATQLYAEAARGTYENGAIAALLIVIVGLPPVMLLARLGLRPAGDRPAASDRG